MEIAAGTRFSRYEIRSRVGAGGMGDVYLAQDMNLNRPVALKLLPAEIQSKDRLHRFEQEARAASALNHPNILTIYEIGVEGEAHFIATEFIDGETLRQHMAHVRAKLHTVLDVCMQVASALAAAHQAGIVHRDIKPENIMIRRDGYVKVLDFGLAKLTERQSISPDTEAQTVTLLKTEPGVVMGTVTYMSPEQAQGLQVDARTDIWSVGVVLYEMLTGHVPFEGPTYSHVIVSILEKEPPPFVQYTPIVPGELERIVMKALAKDCEERYQTIKDLLIDLRRLNKRLEAEAELERSVPPDRRSLSHAGLALSGSSSGGISEQATSILTDKELTARTAEVEAARSTSKTPPVTRQSSINYAVSGIKQYKASAAIMIVTFVAAVAGLAFGIYKFIRTGEGVVPFRSMKITRLTTTGKATDATISPEGNYVVHVVNDGGQQSLWMRQVATAGNIQVVPPAEVQYRGLTFSPDGNFIYYVVREKANPAGVLYQVPTLGGEPKKIIVGIDRPITFSPDRKRFAFVRNNYPNAGEKALMVANADGSSERRVAAPGLPNNFWSPAWSPDGNVIACAAVGSDGGLHVNVIGVNVEDGAVSPITQEKWFDVGRVQWLKDNSGLLITATAQWSGFSNQVWHLSYPDGGAHRVTNDLNDYSSLGLTANSSALVTVQAEHQSSIWIVAPERNAAPAQQITSGTNKHDGYYDLSWTPDGQIVYASTASGNEDIWIMGRDGTNPKQLTVNAGINLFPSVSPDGRYIVFTSTRAAGNTNIWRMDVDGGSPVKLTDGQIDNFPGCSPDGRWVVYMSNVAGKRTLWKVPIEGGDPVQVIDKISSRPIVSPDGTLIACYYLDEQPNSPLKIVTIPFAGGQPTKIFDIPAAATGAIPSPLRWSPDGRALSYIDTGGGVSNVWSQPVDGGKPVQLTDLKSGRIFSFDWSRDGKQLALALGAETSDVVIIDDLKK